MTHTSSGTGNPANGAPHSKSIPSTGKGTILGVIIGIVFALMAVILLPTTIVILVGLVPSAVAFFVDTSRERLLGSTVLCMNIAGLLPAVLRLWKQGHTMDMAITLISQPSVLVVILVSSGVGWLLYIYMPQFVSKLARKRAEVRIRTLERLQGELIEQWSKAVAGTSAQAALTSEEKNRKENEAKERDSISSGTMSA